MLVYDLGPPAPMTHWVFRLCGRLNGTIQFQGSMNWNNFTVWLQRCHSRQQVGLHPHSRGTDSKHNFALHAFGMVHAMQHVPWTTVEDVLERYRLGTLSMDGMWNWVD